MSMAESQIYLGNVFDQTGTILPTIMDRKNRGIGIISKIMTILQQIPLGKHRIEIGLQLRESYLLNYILFSCVKSYFKYNSISDLII